jgi:DNA polymerase-3 subunit delta
VTPAEAIGEAKSANLRPVYLLLGEDVRLQADVLLALKEAGAAGGIEGLNMDQLIAGEQGVSAVLAAARTSPMMAKRRVVVVRQLERWQAEGKANEALDQLAAYADDPCPSTVLLLSASKLDKRRRLVTSAVKRGFLVSCEPLSPTELKQWVLEQARVQGHPLRPAAAELLADLAGPELAAVADALERVGLFVGAGAEIDENAITECVVRLRETSVWELVDAVGRRDIAAAFKALHDVYDPADRGLPLLGVLAWSARQMLRYEAATSTGLSPPEAAKWAGAPPFRARQLDVQVKRLGRQELEHWLVALADLDRNLKGGSRRPPRATLEEAILSLCQAAGRRPAGPPAA